MSRWWLLLLFCSVLTLRLSGIEAESLWYDESFSAALASLSLPRLIAATSWDVHPPLWYVIEWVSVHGLGASEYALRLPAAFCSAGSSVVLWVLVKQVSSRSWAAWIAAALFALAPGQHYYGQEARMYALLTLLMLFATYAVIVRNWLLFSVSIALSLYTHNMAVLFVAPLSIYALWQDRASAIRALLFAGAAYSPWLPVLKMQLSNVGSSYWIPATNLGGALYYLYYGTFGSRSLGWFQGHLIGLSIGLTCISLYVLRDKLRQYAPLLLISFGPPVLLFLISVVWRPMMLQRTLIPACAGVLALWAAGLDAMSTRSRRFAYALLIPALALSWYGYVQPDERRYNVADHTEVIREHWHSGDVIYHINEATYLPYQFYLSNFPEYMYPHHAGLDLSLTEPASRALGIHEVTLLQLADLGYSRAWVPVAVSDAVFDPQAAEALEAISRYPVLDRQIVEQRESVRFELVLIDLRESSYGFSR